MIGAFRRATNIYAQPIQRSRVLYSQLINGQATTVSRSVATQSMTSPSESEALPIIAVTSSGETLSLLTQHQAARIDEILMETFSTDQLMELAGLSVAQIVQSHFRLPDKDTVERIVVVCGPGNNGGDGLVAARHLKMFHAAAQILVVYPRLATVEKPLFKQLLAQLAMCEVPVVAEWDVEQHLLDEHGQGARTLIVDAMLGYSSRGTVREPYRSMIQTINVLQQEKGVRYVAVDIPSGWDVELGPPTSLEGDAVGLNSPDVLISLMAPKQGVRCLLPHSADHVESSHGTTAHYVGGRFVPPAFQREHGLQLATFPAGDQYVRVA